MLTLLNIEFPPLDFPSWFIILVNILRAAPIPTSPLVISDHDNVANVVIALPSISQLLASANKAILVETDILTSEILLSPTHSVSKPVPVPTNPLAISSHDSPDIFTIALASILSAADIITIEPAALITPFVSYLLKVLFIDLKDRLSIVNNDAIEARDLPISSTLRLDILSIAPANKLIASAISNNAVALIPVVNASNESCRESMALLNFSTICPILPSSPFPNNSSILSLIV